MYPMSLYESNESNGSVSLLDLFNKKELLENGCISDLTIEDLVFAACRGGWPESVLLNDKEAQLAIPKDYFNQIIEEDMFNYDKKKRSKATMKALLKSYARNISTLAKDTNIEEDIKSTRNITRITLDDYIELLENLFIIEDLYGWCPNIRSKNAIRSGRKREFVDPSIVVAALGLSPDILNLDLNTFGFIFETLCIRDLRVYSSALNGEMSYYHDKHGLEADGVLHLGDGRYALLEFKLGSKEIEKGASHLCEIERLIKEHNKKDDKSKIRLPDLKIVITGGKYGYKTSEDVYVIPIGCLKD